jgi:hypothetical protein
MFVRFRKTPRRLQVIVVETRRARGKVISDTIGTLGSISVPTSVGDRQTFWTGLFHRLAGLSNRIGPDDQAKIRNAVHARIPMVLPDEANADEAKYWGDYSATWAEFGARNREHARSAIEQAEKDEVIAAIFAENRAAALRGERPMERVIVGELLAARVGFRSEPRDGEACVNPLTGEASIRRVAKRPHRNDRRRRRGGTRFTPKPVEGWEPPP